MTSSNQFIPTIAVIGLPSSGKSTFANSIALKRLLKTGVCRTTIESTFIGSEYDEKFNCDDIKKIKLVSDDSVEFNLIDLPGISDSEDKNESFDKLTNDIIIKADVTFWLTPIDTAFLTHHEKNNFDSILTRLESDTKKTGMIHQVAIVVTKCNDDYFEEVKVEKEKKVIIESDEIDDEDEDTTFNDCIRRVDSLYGDGKRVNNIMQFNAFGRIIHHKKSSDALKKIIKNKKSYSKCNIKFNIKWTTEDIGRKKNESFVSAFIFRMDQIITIVNSCNNISGNNYLLFKEDLIELGKIIDKITSAEFYMKLVQFLLVEDVNIVNDESIKLITINYPECRHKLRYNISKVCRIKGSAKEKQVQNQVQYIIKKYNVTMTSMNMAILSNILDVDKPTFKRLYYNYIPKNNGQVELYNIIENKMEIVFSIIKECDISENNNLHHFDKKIIANNLICVSNTFMAEVLEERKSIYPEQNVSMEIIFMFFINGEIKSVLQSINGN